MKRKPFNFIIVCVFVLSAALPLTAQNSSTMEKQYSFNVAPRGEEIFEITVPEGAKKVNVVLQNQSEMVNMELIGPDGTVLSKTSTWSNMSNWQKPLKSSASVVNNPRQKPGVWKIKVTGSVHSNKLDKVNSVSGDITVTVTGSFPNQNQNKVQTVAGSFPVTSEYSFNVAPRGDEIFEITVPEGAKKVNVVLQNQSEMVNMELIGPDGTVLSKTSTWSNMSNWQKPLNSSASVVNNPRQKPGVWKIKVTGSVHSNKLDKVNSVSGNITVSITD